MTAELMGIDKRTVKVYYKITNRKIDAEFSRWNTVGIKKPPELAIPDGHQHETTAKKN
jgi:hypothetical protein